MNRLRIVFLGLVLLLGATPALAQEQAPEEPNWKQLVERGDYVALAAKLRTYLDLERADPALRSYLEQTLAYLERGARPAVPGSEIVVVRGAKNDRAFVMPSTSGGAEMLVSNEMRYSRGGWDKQLKAIRRAFRRATTQQGGDGEAVHELQKILTQHKSGGLGQNAGSKRSVMISTSTRAIRHFGPPFYVLKIAPERLIFNAQGLAGEREVLVPFFVLPHEIAAKVETVEQANEHPLVRESPLRELSFEHWATIEENIRNGRTPLEGVVGLNSYFARGVEVGPNASADMLERFRARVERHGGVVERVAPGDGRLPAGVQARTTLAGGRPKVLLPEGPVRAYALLDELTHVIQLRRAIDRQGAQEAERLLVRATLEGDPVARHRLNELELQAKRMVSAVARPTGADREALRASMAEIRAELERDRPLAELADAVRREALERALNFLAERLERTDAERAERVRDKVVTQHHLRRFPTGPVEPALQDLFRLELARGELSVEDLRLPSTVRRTVERLRLREVDRALVPESRTAFNPPRRQGLPPEVLEVDPRAPHSMNDLSDYISNRLSEGALKHIAREGWQVEVHAGSEREAFADLTNRGYRVLTEVATPGGNYERLFVAQGPEGDLRAFVTGAEGLDRVRHLSLLARMSGVPPNRMTLVGDTELLRELQVEELRAGFSRLGPSGSMAFIGFRARMGRLLTARALARRGVEHARALYGSDPVRGLEDALRAEARAAEGPARARLESLGQAVRQDGRLAGLREDPGRVFTRAESFAAVERAEKRLAELAARHPESETLSRLVGEGRLRLPGGALATEYEAIQRVDAGVTRFDGLRVQTPRGVEGLKLVNNIYGDAMSGVARALLESGHDRLAYFGTAGGIAEGSRVGDVHVPSRLAARGAPAEGWNALANQLQGAQTPLGERLRVGTTLTNVWSPIRETREWLDRTRAAGVHVVEVEVGHLASEVERHNQTRGSPASLHAAVIVSDVVGGEHTLGNNNSAPKGTFDAMVDQFLRALQIQDVELQERESLRPGAPRAADPRQAAAQRIAEALVQGKPKLHRFLRDRIAEVLRSVTGLDLERLAERGAGASPARLPAEVRDRVQHELNTGTSDASLRTSLVRADAVLSRLADELRRRHGDVRLRVGGGVERGTFSPSEGLVVEVEGQAERVTAQRLLPQLLAEVSGAPSLRLGEVQGGLVFSDRSFRNHPAPLVRAFELRGILERGVVVREGVVEYTGREHRATAEAERAERGLPMPGRTGPGGSRLDARPEATLPEGRGSRTSVLEGSWRGSSTSRGASQNTGALGVLERGTSGETARRRGNSRTTSRGRVRR